MEAAAPRRAGSVGRFISRLPRQQCRAAAAVFNGGVTSAGGIRAAPTAAQRNLRHCRRLLWEQQHRGIAFRRIASTT